MNNGMALEATRRAESYTKPWATGREVVPGQVDAPSVKPMLQKFRKPDGSLTMWRPSSDYMEIYSDMDVPLSGLKPHADALYWDAREALSRLRRSFSSRGSGYGYSRDGRSYTGRIR